MYLIDTKNRNATPLEKKSFSDLKLTERYDLQEWIINNPKMLGEELLIIQKEFDGFPETNERLDLLALDVNGALVIIENKLDDSGRDVVWQSLKYVSYCAALTKSEICDIYQKYLGHSANAQEKISEFYDGQEYESIKLNPSDIDQRIILVAANFRKEVTSTVLWLRDHKVDITCIKATPYKDGEKLYLDMEQILPIQDIGDYQIRLTAKKQEDNVSAKEEAKRFGLRRRFWEMALPLIREKSGIFMNVSASTDHWLSGGSGHGGAIYQPVIMMDGARAELMLTSSDKDWNKRVFNKLFSMKDDIERSFGGNLDWQELPDKKACRICVHYDVCGLKDEDRWADMAEFLADNIARLVSSFKPMLDKVIKG